MRIGVIGTGAGNMRALGGDGRAEIVDPISARPVIAGKHGKAWLCDLAEARRRLSVRDEDDGTLAHWIVEAPWAHPVWHSYSIVLVHLRPMPDGRKTLIYLDDASHELWVMACDPNKDRNGVLAGGSVDGLWLYPKNFAAQFIEITDELAQERVKRAVEAVCDGRLSPDTDFISAWAQLFGDNMLKDRRSARPPRER
jgi:hypothetical protein